MNKLVKSVILVFGLLLFQTQAFSMGDGKGQRSGIRKLLKQLDLSSEQMAKLKTFRGQNKNTGGGKKTRESLKLTKQELDQAFKSDATDDAIRAIHVKMQGLRAELSDLHFNKLLKIRSILTKEQKEKFHTLKKEMRAKRGRKNRGNR